MLYILAGPDDFSLSLALGQIKKGLGDPGMLAAATTQLDGPDVTPDGLREVCQTLPFLAEKRLVIVRGLLGRFETRQASGEGPRPERTPARDPAPYAQVLANLPDTTIVILIEDSLPKSSALFKEVLGRATVKSFPMLKGTPLLQWVQARTREKGGSLSPEAAGLLCQLVGGNLWAMASEIDKLVLYAEGRRIEAEDVRTLVSSAQDISVFAMIDAIVDFKAEAAGQLLQQLLRRGAAPAYLLFMLDRQFRMIVRAKELKAQGQSDGAVQTKLGISATFALERTLAQAGHYSMARLKHVYQQLLEADLSIKTGRFDGELALYLLVASLTRRGAQPTMARTT